MGEKRVVNTSCSHDCGGRCVLKVHVDGDRIVRIETDDGDEPQLRACLRGRAYRQRVYSPDRLKYPMKREGNRGEGKFRRIGWDEALDEVAAELLRVREYYGNSSILMLGGGGSQSILHSPFTAARLLGMFGGFTRTWGVPSFEGALFSSMATYGTLMTGNSREDLLNSRLIIMWGWNPAVTIWDTNTAMILIRAKERGIPIISVDPRFTESTAILASEWIPIRPATDTAMLIAMAYVMISGNLHDRDFLNTYTVGFGKFEEYVMGIEDGIPKTPDWASQITGVPSATIERIAVSYAGTRPAALIPGWGPARTYLGEQFNRAACTLAAMTGNVGKEGGYAGGFMRAFHSRLVGMPWAVPNPVDRNRPPRPYSMHRRRGAGFPSSARIHWVEVYDAILRGTSGGYPCDPKLAYVVATNPLCSFPDLNTGIKAFESLEFVVVHEQRMTPTAKYADVLLPVNTFMEREDMVTPWLGSPYYLYMNQVIEPMYESKTDLEIFELLAPRLGITDFLQKKDEEHWLREVVDSCGDIPDFDEFKREGAIKLTSAEPYVAFKEQIQSPEEHPFPTGSGRIEIYCEELAEMDHPLIPPIPKYISSSEVYDDSLSKIYPLQLVTTHHKAATHSTLERISWLDELEPRRLWIHKHDAQVRGISDEESVMVFNDRGAISMRAMVTERIMPGVVNIGEGAWFELNGEGTDIGGCANMLTSAERSPGGAWQTNAVQIEVRKISK